MTEKELKNLVQSIVEQATALKNKYTDENNVPVNYACIFSQSDEEFYLLLRAVEKIGAIIKETLVGPVYHIKVIDTISGQLKLLKIRKPDKTRPERGYADFTIEYDEFKKKYLGLENFKLIVREDSEMIELMDQQYDVRVYFPDLPLDWELKI